MQIIKDIPQGSDEWLQLRLGVATASRFKDVMAKGQGKTRLTYMTELAAEALTGLPQDKFSSSDMEWGTECEPQAIAMYELITGFDTERISFIKHDKINVGCSPDIFAEEKGLAEFKCPKTTTQIKRFMSGVLPPEYKKQVQGQLWISEREWCDFVSFDPRINGDAGYFSIRVERDDIFIKEIETEVISFCDELAEMVDKLK